MTFPLASSPASEQALQVLDGRDGAADRLFSRWSNPAWTQHDRWVERTARRTWADRLRFWVRIANKVEVLQLRLFGVSGVSLMRRRDVLVLETIGRRTRKRRRSPVTYLRNDNGSFRIGGGAGGMTRVDWVANLRSQGDAVVFVRRKRLAVRVHELQGEQRDAAHAAAASRWPEVLNYERMSDRQIPYFQLTPMEGA